MYYPLSNFSPFRNKAIQLNKQISRFTVMYTGNKFPVKFKFWCRIEIGDQQ